MATAGGIKAGRAFVVIGAVDKTAFVLKRVSRQIRAFGMKLRNMGRQFATGGLMAMLPAAASIKIFSNFDDAMRRVEARSTGTASAMEALRDEAKLLGRTTSFTASQVGDLMSKLAQKNFNRAEIKAMTGDVLNLARAAGSGDEGDTVLASDLISGTLRAFKMEASDATRVSDIFSEAVNNSNFDLQGLMDGMKKAAPLAADYGLSLEETTASLAAMTNLNIEASEAGTAFQSFLARMSQGTFTDAFNKGLSDMGRATIKFRDDAGNLRSPLEIMQEIGTVTEGMGTAVKGELLSALFGVRQFGKASGSISGNMGAMDLLKTLQDSGGKAEETAKAMDRGIGGSFRKIMSAVEGLAISIGEILAPTIQNLTDRATKWIGVATEWMENNKGLVVLFTSIIAGVVLLGVGLFTLGMTAAMISMAFGGLAAILGVVKLLFLGLFAVISSPFTLVAVAIAGVIFALYSFSDAFRSIFDGIVSWVKGKFSEFGETIMTTFKGITAALGQGDFTTAWELLVQGATLIWLQFVDTLADAWNNFAGFFVEVWVGAMGSMKQLWLQTQQTIANGLLDLAAQEGFIGDMMDAVLGVDVSAEKKRGIELERQRMELLTKQGMEATPQDDSFTQARKAMNASFRAKIDSAGQNAGKTLSDFNQGVSEGNKLRQAEIEKRKAALNALVDEVEARDAAKADDDGDLAGADGEGGAGGAGLPGGLAVGRGGMAPQLNTALMKGSVEAAKKAYENFRNAEDAEKVDLDEDRNGLLKDIDTKIGNLGLNQV